MTRTTKQRTVFQSTKQVFSSATDIVVVSAETTAEVVGLGSKIFSNNLKAVLATAIRDNSTENSEEVDESLDVCDARLDNLDALLADKGLTARQKARLQMRIQMWEETAKVVEATSKF